MERVGAASVLENCTFREGPCLSKKNEVENSLYTEVRSWIDGVERLMRHTKIRKGSLSLNSLSFHFLSSRVPSTLTFDLP